MGSLLLVYQTKWYTIESQGLYESRAVSKLHNVIIHPGLEPLTLRFRVQSANHYTIEPYMQTV